MVRTISRKRGINVTKEETIELDGASELIEKYGITKIPSIIVMGDVDNLKLTGFEAKENLSKWKLKGSKGTVNVSDEQQD